MTKRYDLSKIMKRAWELVKSFMYKIGAAMKKAWHEAKAQRTELIGSPKQIAWAEDIRRRFVDCTINNDSKREIFWKVATVKKASWWIDNRDRLDHFTLRTLKGQIERGNMTIPE